MEPVAFVEVLDRRGQVRARQAIGELPATIGRDYRCAVILDDRWVSPVHARISRDEQGRLVVEDNASENGLFRAGGGGKVASLEVGSGVTVRIGRTFIRVADPAAPLAPTLRYGARLPGIEGWLEAPRVTLVATLLAAGLGAGSAWAARTDAGTASTVASTVVVAMGLMAVWAGIWAFFGRGSAPGGRFLGHLTVVAACAVAIQLLIAAEEYARFFWPAAEGVTVTGAFVAAALVATLFAGHLFLNTRLRRARLLVASVLLTGATVGLVALSTGDSGSDDAGFSATLKPVRASLVPAGDAGHFFDELPQLKAAVDSLASDST